MGAWQRKLTGETFKMSGSRSPRVSSCVGVRAPDVGIGFQKGGGGTLSGEGGSDQTPEPET